jgi:hypothetical protein
MSWLRNVGYAVRFRMCRCLVAGMVRDMSACESERKADRNRAMQRGTDELIGRVTSICRLAKTAHVNNDDCLGSAEG